MTSARRKDRSLTRSPIAFIAVSAVAIRLIHITILHILSRLIPPFDSSHTLFLDDTINTGRGTNSIIPGLRWDSIHFLSIAKDGYQWEQQLAFQPLLLGILRILGGCLSWLKGRELNVQDIVFSGMIFNSFVWVGSCVSLYNLTFHLYSTKFALLTTILYMIPPTPVPSLPYTEPLYAFTTFSGIYFLIVKKHYLLSGLTFAVATATRATGIFNVLMLGGSIILGDLPTESLSGKAVSRRLFTRSWKAIIPCILTISPFLIFQWYAYQSFCSNPNDSEKRPWCDQKLPFVYGFVQKEYWNNGLFNYWSISNIPNFILPLPIFLVSISGTCKYLKSTFGSKTRFSSQGLSTKSDLLILYIHHMLMLSLLLFASHTQILLRTCITDPVIWWNIASLSLDRKENRNGIANTNLQGKNGNEGQYEDERKYAQQRNVSQPHELKGIIKWWIGWCAIWSTVATILWVGHYPPA
ncbi:uncharacterized protein L201_001066 [Kwoniella dendrophila CBS 6074]|uniref:GPI mannosyltransferase 2 n=1 Tax=Kwoniella dendrophila CBS 6074 TaxID=1295534 RepID=A0AAX4JMR4_9TREE